MLIDDNRQALQTANAALRPHRAFATPLSELEARGGLPLPVRLSLSLSLCLPLSLSLSVSLSLSRSLCLSFSRLTSIAVADIASGMVAQERTRERRLLADVFFQ
jgi:hypothetical protein